MIIDSHCHIDLYADPRKVLIESEKAGIVVLSMTNLPSHFEMGLPFFLNSKKIRPALGMHPLFAQYHEAEFSKFESNFSNTSYIGEVGLDFSREGFSTKEIQLKTFIRILNLVSGQKKILSIHSRRAEKEVLNLLIEHNVSNAIFHWYSGPLNLIDQIVEGGYYFSVNPAMIKSESGKKIIQRIPLDRLLTETDGPFIEEGGKTIMPGRVESVIQYLALLWNVSQIEVETKIKANFKKLINTLKSDFSTLD
jgi:TatD DNase family protein